MKKVKDLQDDLGRVVQEQRSLFDAGKNKTAEERATYDATSQRATDLIKEIDDLKVLESREAMLLGGADAAPQNVSTEAREASAFANMLRGGATVLTEEERGILQIRATGPQSSGTPAEGGYTIPVTLYDRIIQAMKMYGGMMNVATVLSTSQGNPLDFITADDTANVGSIVSENAQIPDAEKLAFGKITLGAYMYKSNFIRVPFSLLRDSAIDLNSYVIERVAERVGRIVNTHMTVGTGTGQPKGIVTAAGAGVSAAATAITLDNVLNLIASVDPAYRGNGKFMFNDSTLTALRTIKDGQGRYVWDMGNVSQGVNPTIWGYGYQINQDVASIGASAKSIVFGDLSQYYIRQVGGARLKRDEYKFVDYDQIAFLYLQAFDGNLLNTAAVKVLIHAAS